jgi:hypothetical protein
VIATGQNVMLVLRVFIVHGSDPTGQNVVLILRVFSVQGSNTNRTKCGADIESV